VGSAHRLQYTGSNRNSGAGTNTPEHDFEKGVVIFTNARHGQLSPEEGRQAGARAWSVTTKRRLFSKIFFWTRVSETRSNMSSDAHRSDRFSLVELIIIKLAEDSIFIQKVLQTPFLCDLTFLNHNDPVRVQDGREAMRNDYSCSAFGQVF